MSNEMGMIADAIRATSEHVKRVATVHFDECTFSMRTTLAGKKPVITTITLQAADVPVADVANALCAGASRKTVRAAVYNKNDSVPTEETISWLTWVAKPVRQSVVQTRDPTPEEMRARWKESPDYKLKMRALLEELVASDELGDSEETDKK